VCGIFGHTQFDPSLLEVSRRALHTLTHRGPDQWGDWHRDNVYLGHRRLSILDLSPSGRQPMVSGDNDVAICVNGEIYNYIELRAALEDKYAFTSRSDSETVLHGYIEWGIDDLLKRLDGMFALAIVDMRQNRLFLARDRFGQKPMYYSNSGGGFSFASEIKALMEFDDALRTFSYEGIKEWLYYRGNPTSRTIYHNVHQLRQGRYLEYANGAFSEHVYYDVLDYVDPADSEREPDQDELSHLLDAAVTKRLISDVPVGTQLSGGVDSSLVTHYARKHSDADLLTFSFGFSGAESERYSEEAYARQAAQHVGTEHRQYNSDGRDVGEVFRTVVHLSDGLLDYPNTIAIYLLSRFTKPHITVSLTGEGADELFGGYKKFDLAERLGRGRQTPLSALTPLLSKLSMPRMQTLARSAYLRKRYAGEPRAILENLNSYVSRETLTRYFGEADVSLFDELDYSRISAYPFYKQLLIVDHKTYLRSLLDRQDRASMGAAIEARLPFLDRAVVEWGMAVGKRGLYDRYENKRVLKSLCAELFGHEFAYRRKKGFLPVKRWIDSPHCFKPYLDAAFRSDFLLREKLDFSSLEPYLNDNSFAKKNLNYGDDERVWIKWYLMVLRAAQDVFSVRNIV